MEILCATQVSAVNRMDSTDSALTAPLGWKSSISGLFGIEKISWASVAGTGDGAGAVGFETCKVEGGLSCWAGSGLTSGENCKMQRYVRKARALSIETRSN